MEKFLISIAVMTSIALGMAAYRLIEHAYGANLSFLIGFVTLIISIYFINASN